MFQGDIQGNPGLDAKVGGDSRKFWVGTCLQFCVVACCLLVCLPHVVAYSSAFAGLRRQQMTHVARVLKQL